MLGRIALEQAFSLLAGFIHCHIFERTHCVALVFASNA
jgi:hypothetical protein